MCFEGLLAKSDYLGSVNELVNMLYTFGCSENVAGVIYMKLGIL